MSVLLKSRCVRSIHAKTNVCVAQVARDPSVATYLVGKREKLLRHTLPGQKVGVKRYFTTAPKRQANGGIEVICPRIGSVVPSRTSMAAVGASHALQSFPKRYQHSHILEAPADVDHAPIIASCPEWIKPQDTLPKRHIGPSDEEIAAMLKFLKQPDLETFIEQTIPNSIRASKEFRIPSEQTSETEMINELTKAGKANSAADVDTYIGMGYHPTITPGVIKRNVLENPGWYTSYTPYQPEISQGLFAFTIF
jgi:Glycine cleavage system P-protein